MTTDPRARYPNIYRAALEIALDNGGINRTRPVEQQEAEFYRWLAQQPSDPLPAIETWLATLTDDQLQSAVSGAEPEDQALLATAPPFTDDLLTRYFEEVC